MIKQSISISKFGNRVTETNYFDSYFNVNSNTMKLLWSGIKSIVDQKNTNSNLISKLKDKNGSITTLTARSLLTLLMTFL